MGVQRTLLIILMAVRDSEVSPARWCVMLYMDGNIEH